MHTAWNFQGRTVLVTGGSQGIGAAAVTAFARAGAEVAVNCWPDAEGRNVAAAKALCDRLNTDTGRTAAWPEPADVRDTGSVGAMLQRIAARTGGRLDVLLNNAAVLRDRSLAKMSDAEWTDVVDTNLSGVFRVTRAALPLMGAGGRVISIASVAGQVGFFGQTNYGAAKAGVEGFTRALAKELARRGVTVNAVAPGLVDTSMAASIPEEARRRLLESVPLGRMAEPADIVNAILFLASADSGYITGQTLNVNGGWHA